jgi:hypothetical protein
MPVQRAKWRLCPRHRPFVISEQPVGYAPIADICRPVSPVDDPRLRQVYSETKLSSCQRGSILIIAQDL